VIVDERRLSLFAAGGPFGLRQTLVTDSRVLAVIVKLRHNLGPVAQFLDGLECQVIDLRADVGEPRGVYLGMGVIDQVSALPPRAAVIEVRVEVIQIAAPHLKVAFWLGRRHARNKVHDAADGLRAVEELPAAFQHLDAIESEDRRKVVRGRVAIRHEHDRHAVLHDVHFSAAGRVQAANADIGSEADSVLIPDMDARDFAQRFIDRQPVVLFDALAGHDLSRSRDMVQRFRAGADHLR
jgi:hypothetical protein